MHLRDKIWEVINDPEIRREYPNGMSAADMVQYTREDFPLCTVIDCADELRGLFS